MSRQGELSLPAQVGGTAEVSFSTTISAPPPPPLPPPPPPPPPLRSQPAALPTTSDIVTWLSLTFGTPPPHHVRDQHIILPLSAIPPSLTRLRIIAPPPAHFAFLADIARGNHSLRSRTEAAEIVDSDASAPEDTDQARQVKRFRRGIKAIVRGITEASLKASDPVKDKDGNVLTPRRASLARRPPPPQTPMVVPTLKRRARPAMPVFEDSSQDAQTPVKVKEYHSPRQRALARKLEEARNTPATFAVSSRGQQPQSNEGDESAVRKLFSKPQDKDVLDLSSLRKSLRRTRPAPSDVIDVFDDDPTLEWRHTLAVSPQHASLQRGQASGYSNDSAFDVVNARAKLRSKRAVSRPAVPGFEPGKC
ncbi:hypothetical protein CC85DRAFT_300295 [Cutaneotrichosporon oleaginosum]|uniref:Uncharacterized protein n=1 Tax=Cutaneotrichosporon oleaginosum TaxID=879819 RepID=A0A0J0XUM1_9TREE|nr:uncharacterized protein CC85DRAFT_300295 [Cutaneotrichosporon oleaginosum]KLT44752.1 hypothetical protein CC85DRAFT_300295 [Cutaneotrichosporon oleaginosum]TXT07738.1 hypothetical protein COLE_04662 [Cutaneotrichosporon oleaginosum]